MNRRQFLAAAAALIPLGADWDVTPNPSWDVSGEPLAACWDATGEIIKPMPLAIPLAVPAKRKLVTMFTATWCPKCRIEKAKIQAAGTLPFDVRFVDVSNGGQPEWITALPTFWYAAANGGGRQTTEFSDVLDELMPKAANPVQKQQIQQPIQRMAGYHTHTCRTDLFRWGHITGSHNCPKCGRTEYRHDTTTTLRPCSDLLSRLGIRL